MGFLRTTLVSGSGGGGGGSAGFSQVNVDDADLVGGWANVFDTGNQTTLSNGALPTQIDLNGLPSTTLTSGQSIGYALQFHDAQTTPATQWVFKWTPNGTGTLSVLMNGAAVTVVGTPTGCSVSGGNTINMTGGTFARVVFTFNSLPGQNLSTYFLAGAWGANSPKPILCRGSDEAIVDAGGVITPELATLYSGLNLKTLRFMPWTNSIVSTQNNLGHWSCRTPANAIGWKGRRWKSDIFAGNTSGTDAYTVSRPSGISTSDWVDGETIQANVTNASSVYYTATGAVAGTGGTIKVLLPSTAGLSNGNQVYLSNFNGTVEANALWTIQNLIANTSFECVGSTFVNTYTGGSSYISTQKLTVTGKTNGTKLIVNIHFASISAADPLFIGNTTFVYNAAMGVLTRMNDGAGFNTDTGGITESAPIEAMIKIANQLNINMWYTVPHLANDGFVTSLTALVAGLLNPGLCFYIEYSNETWNSGFSSFQYSFRVGNYLGVGVNVGWTGLRAAQIFTLAQTAWAAAGKSRSLLRNALMWQGGGGIFNVQQYTLGGTALNPTGNARLTAYLGGTTPNFSAVGNRPADLADVVGYATYYFGALCTSVNYPYTAGRSTYFTSSLQTMANLFNTNANDATALAMIDKDLRNGIFDQKTITVTGTTTSISSAAHGFVDNYWVSFETTGTLPSPLAINRLYHVVGSAANTFSVALGRAGTAISINGATGSGTHKANLITDAVYAGHWNLLVLASIYYQAPNSNFGDGNWENIVAGFDATRGGKPPLRMELYEGALEARSPNASDCATMGITVSGSSATAATALLNGYTAYKNSALAAALATDQFKQFMGTDSTSVTFGIMAHSKTPSWFNVAGPGAWSLLPGQIGTTPFKTYDGVAAFVGVTG